MKRLTIVEVGPRDGFQALPEPVPTATKLAIARRLHAAGVRRIEIGSFVSPAALPQLADTAELLAGLANLPDLDLQVLVPTARRAEQALAAGARHLSFVLSVSATHNRNNVRRAPLESVEEYRAIIAMLPAGVAMRLNLATAFDCPFQGPTSIAANLALLDALVPLLPAAEIALCDTTGRVTPDRVAALFRGARERFPEVAVWAFHGHDTYGLGVANALAAHGAGVGVVDAAFAGLGGCPWAPGASGNVATEDLAWTAEQMGIETGLALPALLAIAEEIAQLPGAPVGGRVRQALAARARLVAAGTLAPCTNLNDSE